MLPRLKTIRLRNGQELAISKGVTVVVGPNNAGKSVLLRETFERLSNQPSVHLGQLALNEIELEWPGSLTSFVDWLDETYGWRPPGSYSDGQYGERTARTHRGLITESQIASSWGNEGSAWQISSLYALQLDAQSRLGVPLDSSSYNARTQHPTDPAQHLFASRELENEMSELMFRAFGERLTVDRYGGNAIQLLVGRVNAPETAPPPTREYLESLSELRPLSAQGDGIRAFMGILLTIKTTLNGLILIDEPEAFLHPPQARLLGRILAEQNDKGTQVIVATHSEDIVQGITSAAPPAGHEPTIVRLSRRANVSRASQVEVEKVRQLYHDPLLRHSSVMGGLFYQGVAVCEGDSDCTYYQAVLGHLISCGDAPARDIHLMHCGGKARIWKAVDALRSANVPTVAVVDFDILKSDDVLGRLIDTSGGNIEEIAPKLQILRSVVTSKDKQVSKVAALAEIEAAFDTSVEPEVTSGLRTSIANALASADGWREAKRSGSNVLSGDALRAFREVDLWLRQQGIFVVPGGELESFNRSTPSGDKSAWLATVLESKLYETDAEAHEFVKAISTSLNRV